MGLFTNKKNLCPICGSPTPRLLPTKVEGMPLCKECAEKIDVPNETVQAMTLDDFQRYLAFYDENAPLRERFRNEYRFDVNGWSAEVQIDYTHKLFRLSDAAKGIVYEGGCIRSFQILEDRHPLYEGSAAGLRCRDSKAPEYLDQLRPMYDDYLRDRREYERMRAVMEMADRNRDRDRPGGPPHHHFPEPRFDVKKPVEQYHIIITMEHPYRKEFRGDLDGPDFSFLSPDLMETARKYEEVLDSLDVLAQSLMRLFAPEAPIQRPNGAGPQPVQPVRPVQPVQPVQPIQPVPTSAASVDAVAEIRRFKDLMDQGILTEEEFAAKKRQLLGI